MIKTISGIAIFTLIAWSSLAWGFLALLSGSGASLGALVMPLAADLSWPAWVDDSMVWVEHLGTAAVWIVWALGSMGLVATATAATLMLRVARGRSLPRALAPARATLSPTRI